MAVVAKALGDLVLAAAALEGRVRVLVWDVIDGETDDIAHVVTEKKTLGALVNVAKKLVPAAYLPEDVQSRAHDLLLRVQRASTTRNQYLHAEYVAGSDGVIGRLRYGLHEGHPEVELSDIDLTAMEKETQEMNLLAVKVLELSNEVCKAHHARRVKEGRLRPSVPGFPEVEPGALDDRRT